MLMLMLMKTRAKTANMIRKHNKIRNNNKTKHEKHCNEIKTTYANKDKGGSVFTAMRWFSYSTFFCKKKFGTLSPILILF